MFTHRDFTNYIYICIIILVKKQDYKTSIVISDLHLPYHDHRLLKAFYSFLKDFQPDELVLAGDILDFYSLSRFDKSPDRAEDLQYEIDCVTTFFQQVRKIYKKKMVFIPGNHEERLNKFLCGKAKALHDLKCLQIEELLMMRRFNITFSGYIYDINSNLIVKHGEAAGQYPARSELKKEGISGISGHAHKTDIANMNGYNNRITWYSLGHMADKDQLDKHYSRSLRWNQSFAVVKSDSQSFDVEVIEVKDKSFFVKANQKLYKL